MAFSQIPKGIKAANHWLSSLEASRQARRRERFEEYQRDIKTALAPDNHLLTAFGATIEMARELGRVDGLREGLALYEYGLRIQENKTPAFRAVMRYVVNHPENDSSQEICAHLDRQLLRIKELKTADSRIAPPESWACATWTEALEKKRNNVDVFFSEARAEAVSHQFATLMAWAKWGHKGRRKARGASAKETGK